MKVVQYQKKPRHYLGKSIKIFLKAGGSFNYKVTGCGDKHFDGYDDEMLNITIMVEDIDFIVGGDV